MVDNQIHNEIMRALGRIEGKMDGIVARQNESEDTVKTLAEAVAKHQSWIDSFSGKISVISASFGVFSALIVEYVKTKIDFK